MMTDQGSCHSGVLLALLMVSLAGCSGGADPVALTSKGCVAAAEIAVVCDFKNPEDIVYYNSDDGWLIISQMGAGEFASESGSLVAWQPSTGRRQPLWPPAWSGPDYTALGSVQPVHWGDASCPRPTQFSPHGIDLGKRASGGQVLLVVNHREATQDSIELFELRAGTGVPRLQWRGCVLTPLDAEMNDVVVAGDGLITSRMYDAPLPTWLGALMVMGWDTGSVHEWQPSLGWHDIPNSAGAVPNGIALSSDGQQLFIHHYFGGQLLKLDRHSGALLGSAPVVRGDNLSWAPDGSLLSASHPSGLEELGVCHQLEEGVCLSDFLIQRIDPASMRVTAAFRHRGEPFGMATVAVENRGTIYVGSFRADRLAYFSAQRLQAVTAAP